MATADWNPLGDKVYYRKVELYSMEWSGLVDVSKHIAVAAPYGGPIALLKDDSKLGRGPPTVKPTLSVYNAAGRLMASPYRWNSGRILKIGWSNTEDLLCVQDDGVVLVHDIFLNFKRTFGMGGEAKEVKCIDCHIFLSYQGTGIAVMTSSYRIFVLSNVEDPRVRRMAEVPGLHAAPSSWAIINVDRQPRALVANETDLFLVDQGGQYQKQTLELESPYTSVTLMSVSFNNKFLALFTDTGVICICSSDLRKVFCEFNTKSPQRPQELAWAGNGCVVALWDRLMVAVGPDKDWIKYNFDTPVFLVQEEDGLRIIGNDTHDLLQKVPDVTEKIFKIGSIDPGAMLYEASREFQKQSQKADEYIRMIKDKLDLAVDQCIQAAGHEMEPAKQRHLLRAASFGKCFLTDYRPEPFVNMCQMLRVLNTVRHHSVGIPLTYSQLEHLSMAVLIDRLVLRKQFNLAIRTCKYLKIPEAEGVSRILAHWARYKVLQKHVDEDQLATCISQKLIDVPGVSFSEIASQALDQGRKQLAIRLLDYEVKISDQVPLLLKMEQHSSALTRAIESGDTDLVYEVLLHMRDTMQSQGDFFMAIHNQPIAYSLYIQYCRQQNLKMVEDLHYQDDHFSEEASCKIIRSYTMEMFDRRVSTLEEAMHCYQRSKNEFAAKQTEEQIRLLKHQRRLEEELNGLFVDLSLHRTLHALLMMGQHKIVEQLRKEFKVPDKRFWLLKMAALAENGEWAELEKFSKGKKPPVGIEEFVEVCMKHHNRAEAGKYLARVAPEMKVKSLLKMGNLKEAAEAAFERGSEEELNMVLSKCKHTDRAMMESIRSMKGQLSQRK